MEHGKGKCEKLWHIPCGEYGHGPYDDTEFMIMIDRYLFRFYCGRCHKKTGEKRMANEMELTKS